MVQRFAETRSAFEAGAVAHALAAAMRDLLADWHLFVTQLEHQMRIGKLTLQAREPPEHRPLQLRRKFHALCRCFLQQGRCICRVSGH